MDLEQISERLKKLKRKRVESSIKNRKETDSEEKFRGLEGKPKVYSMHDDDYGSKGTREEPKSERDKLLNYSIIEYEKWHQKQKQKKQPSENADVGVLAYNTYRSEIGKLRKEGLAKGRVTKGRITETGKVIVEDEDELIDKLSKNLQKTAQQRYLDRQKKLEKQNNKSSAMEGSINEKNRNFNEKLDREFKRLQK